MIDGAGIAGEGEWMPCNAYANYQPCGGKRVTESCHPFAVFVDPEKPRWTVVTVCLRCGQRRAILSEVFVGD